MENLYELISNYQNSSDELVLEKIIENHMKLIYHVTFKYRCLVPTYDDIDIRQELLMEFQEAVKLYDPTKGAKFSSFAYMLMKNKILNMSRCANAQKRDPGNFIYYESKVPGTSLSYEGVLCDKSDIEYDCVKREQTVLLLEYLIDTLKPQELELYQKYIYGMSVREISAQYSIDEKACRNKLTYIKRKLRNNSKNYKS
jgi:RNA polymerase sigma factor (sigma-70 family)